MRSAGTGGNIATYCQIEDPVNPTTVFTPSFCASRAVSFIWDFKDRIYHVDCKDAKKQVGNGRNGRMGSHLPWADPRRGWDFVSTGHGDVPWEACFRMLNTIGYDGPISVEWEDAGMDRLVGAPEALEFVRRLAFDAPTAAFDAAFSTSS